MSLPLSPKIVSSPPNPLKLSFPSCPRSASSNSGVPIIVSVPFVEPKYELFPGYENLIDSDGDGFGDTVIDPVKNNGRPDAIVPASTEDEFLDYQFSVDNLNKFNGFKIKIVISGTDEAHAPKFQDIRTIALA